MNINAGHEITSKARIIHQIQLIRGITVHPYTVRSDKLPEYTTDVNQLYDALYNKAGVNGLFTDFPDKAVKFLNKE